MSAQFAARSAQVLREQSAEGRAQTWLIALAVFALSAAPVPSRAQETRIASDFEIAQMERQAVTAKDFLSQLSAHLNLGDLHLTRNESAVARSEYRKALEITSSQRTTTRQAGGATRVKGPSAMKAIPITGTVRTEKAPPVTTAVP